MTTAFVAGSTGYTGQSLVGQSAAAGWRTVAHIRPDSPHLARRAAFAACGAVIETVPWEPDALRSVLERHLPEVIFSVLGTTRAQASKAARQGDTGQGYEAVDLRLNELLIRAAVEAAPQARYVLLSAVGARPGARSSYMRARGRVEEALRSSGLPYTILRASYITGPNRGESRAVERIGARLVDRILDFYALCGAKRFRARYASIDNHGLARILMRLAQDDDFAGQTLEMDQVR